MDALEALKAEMNRKRKTVEEANVIKDGKSYFKRGDLLAKEEEQYWRESKKARKDDEDGEFQTSSSGISQSKENVNGNNSNGTIADVEIPRVEVIRRLRARNKPITLFGESDAAARSRLLQHEIEQPELKEGWKNDFQLALKEVDNELVDEVIHGIKKDDKHDVVVPDAKDDWEAIEARALLLGQENNSDQDCDILYDYLTYLLGRWAKDLNARDEEEKRAPKGKLEAGSLKQTVEHVRPLVKSLKNRQCNNDIRQHLVRICRLMIIDRNYIQANNAYMEMAIGNAPWPVGVTRSGIHQRPGSSKAYVSNIAHVLNDETQRKYIQALKRLMGRCQVWFPTDPSKCVEYVKPNGS
ncbi:hypothetical protein L596_019036 [Steinernema carpocapsae]|uniref:Pre-mRNA-splicing factor 18 n=1 Tax=Steinernema carpocapsae TaxID=34508 RepID=A0A4U5N6F4_STECR|nr:hypothetical protein L596_019036 [Steinernema carpocapsae]